MTPSLVGLADTIITPPAGVDMAGYTREGPAVGIHDDLHAVAAIFEDACGRKIALCSTDLVEVIPEVVKAVRARVCPRLGMAPDSLMIAATHTHSGPALTSPKLCNQQWRRELEDRLVRVLLEADANRRAARVGVAIGSVTGVGGNRRDPKHGPVDRSVTVFRIDDARTGAALGLIVNHACHATTLDLHNRLISADYPGFLRGAVAKRLPGGERVPLLFFNGACGNINPGGYSAEASALGKPIPNRTYERARWIGERLGREVVRLARGIRTRPRFDVRGGALPIRLPMQSFPLPAEAEARAGAARQAYEQACRRGIKGAALDALRLDMIYGGIEQRMAQRRFALPNGEYDTEVQGLVVGDVLFLGLPGEVFNEIGTTLKRRSPFPTTVIIGYANDCSGYYPTVDVLADGGYEVRASRFGAVAIERMQGWAQLLATGLHRSASTRPAGEPAKRGAVRGPRRAKFPAVDCHLHCWGAWPGSAEKLAALKAANVRYGVCLVGDRFPQAALEPALARAREEHGRLLYFSGLDFTRLDDPNWSDLVRRKLDHDVALGARGLKLFKTLGLTCRDRRGSLIRPDDPRLDPVWSAAAERGLPVLYHVGDPLCRFQAIETSYEQLKALADRALDNCWAAPGHPSHETLIRSLEAVVAAHPDTVFIGAHLASLDHDLARCGRLMDRYPNFHVDTAGRLASLGRQPRAARALCLAHPDRILFGTDCAWPNQDGAYHDWFRLLETRDAAVPCPGGGEPLSGLGLPDDALRLIYGGNMARLLRLDLDA